VLGGVKEKPRIWRQIKRRLRQPIILQIHAALLAETRPWASTGTDCASLR
jgi:hypothetical protein